MMEFNRKIGNEINIGGYLISIEEVKNFMRDNEIYGEWRPAALKIIVDADLPLQLKNETIFHEILEAITGIYDIEIKHHKLLILSVVLNQILTDAQEF